MKRNVNIIKGSQLINRPINLKEGMDAIAKQITDGIAEHYKNNPHTVFDVELDFGDDNAKTLTDETIWYLQDCFRGYLRDLPFIQKDLEDERLDAQALIYWEDGKLRMTVPIMDEKGYEWNPSKEELRCCWGEYTITNVFNEDIAYAAYNKLHMKRSAKKGLPIGKYRFEWYGKKLIKID